MFTLSNTRLGFRLSSQYPDTIGKQKLFEVRSLLWKDVLQILLWKNVSAKVFCEVKVCPVSIVLELRRPRVGERSNELFNTRQMQHDNAYFYQ